MYQSELGYEYALPSLHPPKLSLKGNHRPTPSMLPGKLFFSFLLFLTPIPQEKGMWDKFGHPRHARRKDITTP